MNPTIECILHKDLERYLRSERYLQSEVLPISYHRGISHFNNPKAQSEDVVLINIYQQNKLVAYLGLLPDDIHLDNKIFHVGWFSCLWVMPSLRGQGLAKKLFDTAWIKWKNNLIVTDFIPHTEALYRRNGYFDSLLLREGIKSYYRLNLAVFLPQKNKKWTLVKLPLQMVDGIFNTFWNLRKALITKEKNEKIQVKRVEEMSTQALAFIDSFQKSALIKKDKIDFLWQSKFPWINNSKEAEKNQKRFYFSSFAKRFQRVYLEFFDEKKMVGFILLTIRDDALKIPYVYFDKKNNTLTKKIIEYIFELMTIEKIATISCSDEVLCKEIKTKKSMFFLNRSIQKKCLLSTKILAAVTLSKIQIQDGDGDAVFT